MQHFLTVATLITMLGAVVALPICTVILYRRALGSRSAIVGTFLWATGWALFLIIPAALTLDGMGWIPPDADIRDIASAVSMWPAVLGLLLSMVGLRLAPLAKRKESAR